MPGEATQRIVLCGPYAAAGAHDPHPVTTVEGQAWCPGNPPQHPDGSPVTGDDVREQAVPLAGELRALTDEVRAAADDALRKAGRLQAEAYSVTVDGIECRVIRGDQSSGRLSRKQLPYPAWWEATIDRVWSQEMTVYDPDSRRSAGLTVTTTAWFPFDPADIVNEQAMLERASGYCNAVVHAILRLRAEQVATRDAFIEAVQAAAATHGAVTPE